VTPLSLLDVDRDGALEEALDAVGPLTRDAFLRHVAATGAAAGAGAAALSAAAEAEAAGLAPVDLAILRFDLVLEYLQAGMYTEAERIGAISKKTMRWSRVIGAHEWAHAAAIKSLLGSQAIKPPRFNYHGVTEDDRSFTRTAVAFEDLTTALLKSQALRLKSRNILAAVATLHSVEARHAAWVRHQLGYPPAFTAFDPAASEQRMRNLIRRTGFIVGGVPKTGALGTPAFTG
jgi:hypothetical protein